MSLVLQVEREDGTPAVLKINFPEEETEREPDAPGGNLTTTTAS